MSEYKLIDFSQLYKADIIFSTQRDSTISATIRAVKVFVHNTVCQSKLVVILVLFFFVSVFSGCGVIYRSGFVPVPKQTVSGPIEIGHEWVEIVPPAPLKPYGTQQWIDLGYTEYSVNDYSDQKGEVMNLADGRKTRIEAFLYDDQGESYELQIDGVGVGVMFYRKRVPLTSDENSPSPAVPFPIDRTFIKLRMRSEILLKCNYIEWVGSNPK